MKHIYLSAVFVSTICLSGVAMAQIAPPFGMPGGAGGASRISYSQYVTMDFADKEAAQKVRQGIYADALKECKTLEDATKRSCRLVSVSIKPVGVQKTDSDKMAVAAPEAEATRGVVQIDLEVYDKQAAMQMPPAPPVSMNPPPVPPVIEPPSMNKPEEKAKKE